MSQSKNFSIARKYEKDINNILSQIDSNDVSRFICRAIIEKAQRTQNIRLFENEDDGFAPLQNQRIQPVEPIKVETKTVPVEQVVVSQEPNPLKDKVLELITHNPSIVNSIPEVINAIMTNDTMVLIKVISTYGNTPEKVVQSEEKKSGLANVTDKW